LTVTAEPFAHPAFLYRGAAEYLVGTLPFITDGLDAGEPVAVVVPGPNLALIEAALGDRASSVEFVDMTERGRNPGRIIPAVFLAFADAHSGPVRLVGEPVWAGRSELEYPACAQHEALINVAFEGRDVAMLCPYDLDGLDSAVLADAFRTHPVMWNAAGSRPSRVYAPGDVVATYNQPLPQPQVARATFEFDLTSLSAARHFIAEHGARCGLDPARVQDLTLAASELCANSVLYGRGQGTLHVWDEAGYVVCEVGDRGRITDPLAGRRPAAVGQVGGRGLLLVNQIADLVRTHHGIDGTTIRAYLRV
jgi:anti-sigma regulatory factor (Ser/Thr protein kinase)